MIFSMKDKTKSVPYNKNAFSVFHLRFPSEHVELLNHIHLVSGVTKTEILSFFIHPNFEKYNNDLDAFFKDFTEYRKSWVAKALSSAKELDDSPAPSVDTIVEDLG